LVKRINEHIEFYGSGFGPALNNLLLYGPVDKRHISNNNLDILKDRQIVINQAYNKSIVPKIGILVNAITPDEVKMPKNNSKLKEILKVRPFEEVRKKIASKYNGQFEMSPETLKGLYSDKKLNKNKEIKFAFVNNYLISYRQKNPIMIKKKYDNLYSKLILGKEYDYDDGIFFEFLEKTMSDSFRYWEKFSFFDKVYGELNDFMIGDDFGLKIVDLNQKRSDKTMEDLVSLGPKLKIPGFNIISERFDNHRNRVDIKRPGGIHYTLTDAGLSNFPMEVQFMGIKSFIYDKFGPHAHELYTYRNKKSQF